MLGHTSEGAPPGPPPRFGAPRARSIQAAIGQGTDGCLAVGGGQVVEWGVVDVGDSPATKRTTTTIRRHMAARDRSPAGAPRLRRRPVSPMSCPPCSTGPSRPAWLPGPGPRAEQVVLLVLDGLGWDQLRERPELAPTLCAMDGGRITTDRPVDHRRRPHVDRHRPASRRARPGRLPAVDRGRRAQRAALVDRPGRRPQVARSPTSPAPRAVRRPTAARRHPGRVRRDRLHPGPPGRRPLPRLPDDVHAGQPGRRAGRRGEPFVYAYYEGIDKVAHEYGLGASTTPSCGPPIGWWAS